MKTKVRPGQFCRFKAVGWDLYDRKVKDGEVVVPIKSPQGTPPFGTMGHCYVADAQTGEFIGLVMLASLTPITFNKEGVPSDRR